MRSLLIASLLLVSVACRTEPYPPVADGGVGSDLKQTTFCSGNARAELNGKRADSPSVSARQLFLNCCESAAIDVLSMQLSTGLSFEWRGFVGSATTFPTTLDLAKLPKEFSVSLSTGCVGGGSCQPTDTVSQGMTGTLHIEREFSDYTMSLCMQYDDTATGPNKVIHTAQLWVPTIRTDPLGF